jgi:hypothetical protein
MEDGSSVSKGVDVLSRVNDDVNCVLLHLLVNLTLCERFAVEKVSDGESNNSRSTNSTDREVLEESGSKLAHTTARSLAEDSRGFDSTVPVGVYPAVLTVSSRLPERERDASNGVALRCCVHGVLLIPIEKKRLLRLRIVSLRSRLQLVLYVLHVVYPYLYLTNCLSLRAFCVYKYFLVPPTNVSVSVSRQGVLFKLCLYFFLRYCYCNSTNTRSVLTQRGCRRETPKMSVDKKTPFRF